MTQWPPPLLSERPPELQIVLAVVVPALYGLICGILLSVSGGAYLILSLLGIAGGIAAGFDHATPGEGALRGIAGGSLFGTLILLGHALVGGKAKVDLPNPHVVLPIATTILAIAFGAIGGALRARRIRAANPPPVAL